MKTHANISFCKAVFVFCTLFVSFAVSVSAQETQNAIEKGVDLQDPPNITTKTTYNPETGYYEVRHNAGEREYRPPEYMTLDEYMKYDTDRSLKNYWRVKSSGSSLGRGNDGIIPSIYIGSPLFNRIFGGNTIDVRVQGSIELNFGVRHNFRADPMITKKQQSVTNFVFDEKININAVASIGTKIEFKANYNTEFTFGFENKLQLRYQGDEDEIIQLIEAGNVNLPLNSTLMKGSQSLFGVKTKLKFGKTMITAVVSQQESQSQTVQMEGGGQKTKFEIKSDAYEENRHFFLAQYFYDNYDISLSQLPQILSSINITKMDVWITNIGAAVQDNRNIVAFADLGEPQPYNDRINTYYGKTYPDNSANGLMDQLQPNISQIRNINTVSSFLTSSMLNMVGGRDYEKVESARKLQYSEYSYNPALGFISLRTTLNSNQVLAVAFEYTLIGSETVYRVGELADGGIPSTQTLIVKLLRSTAVDPALPIWKLMMKNVYSLNSYQVNSQDFVLNILFSGSENGVPMGFLPEQDTSYGYKPLIEVLGFDRMDAHQARNPDGLFDFIDNAVHNGGTIQSDNGRIYFTVKEPFGSYLREKIMSSPANTPTEAKRIADKYCYDSLYTMTKTSAQQYPEKNKFLMQGYYKSSYSSEISLNGLNIPEGSVVVTAGGRQLIENVDYVVNYTMGMVTIINEGILNSGTPITVSSESRDAGNLIQKRTFLGVHVDHQVNKDLILGATFMNLFERPLTQKTNLGDEPVNNVMWGLNGDWQQESNMITRWVNVLPFYSSKTPSRVNLGGEFAHFIPGHSKSIGKGGTSYIDDFEAATTTIDLKTTPIRDWFLSSTPQHHPNFPEGNIASNTSLAVGFNRAKMAWYIIDPLFYSNDRTLPSNVTKDELSKNSVRQVLQTEVFPNREIASGQPTTMPILNMAYYPKDIGPYNYDLESSNYSKGINADGELNAPETRWGGVMRRIESSDFEYSNIEYIELWMMDPFSENPNHKGGEILFHLGEISEDILKDSRKSFEHGLPENELVVDVDTTIWGRVPIKQSLVNSFSNDPNSRPFQDVGYDGLRDEDERTFFSRSGQHDYLPKMSQMLGGGSKAYLDAYDDPSHDNFHYFRSAEYDSNSDFASILTKYKNFNGPDGNSSTASPDGYMIQSTTFPNMEDIDNDNTLSEDERYFEYVVSLRPKDMEVTGENHITDIYTAQSVRLFNGKTSNVKWYQFKIPVSTPSNTYGNIRDFRSIRFMRMVFRGFEEEIVCRFAKFQLVRADWRRYQYSILESGEYVPTEDESVLSISSINIEENSYRFPVPYVLPPGIDRETNYTQLTATQRNEQSMVLKVTDLPDGFAKAVYKNTNFDFTQFEYLKMFVHAEDVDPNNKNSTGDLTVFIRVGADITSNYYEYEVPLEFTEWDTPRTRDDLIWPGNNNIEIDLEKLVNYKKDRNAVGHPYQVPYIVYEGNRKVTIQGTPSISEVKAIMIGIRNPQSSDRRSRSAEIWVDELRLTDFINKQGWAATGRIRIDLADFGNIQFTALHTSAGFGSIEEKTNMRSRDNITILDFGTNMELGKMTPENWGVRLPMHFDYSHNRAVPQYSPFDPDIKYKDVVRSLNAKEKTDYKNSVIDVVNRTNINFMNMRKERTNLQKDPHFWDFENWDFSYAYSRMIAHNFDVEYDRQYKHTAGVGYTYTLRPKEVAPFRSMTSLKSPWLKLIKEFNFYYVPNMWSFRTTLMREYQEKQMRNNYTDALIIIQPTYYKNMTWDRNYTLRWDLARSLKLQYNATANTIIHELPGEKGVTDRYGTQEEKKQQIKSEFGHFGTYERYNQATNLTYNLPLDKIPITDWISVTATYDGTYFWMANAWALRHTLGNTIENQANVSLNGRLNMTTLYNKSGYLKKLNSARTPTRPAPSKPGSDPADSLNATQKKDGPSFARKSMDGFFKFLMMVRDISGTYMQTDGTLQPGFMPEPDFFGVNHGAPGWDFVFGFQDKNFVQRAIREQWLTGDSTLNVPFSRKHTKRIQAQATLEPLRDFRIDVNMSRQYSETYSAFMRADANGNFPNEPMSPTITGAFNISTIMIKTAFKKTNTTTPFNSAPYNEMRENRLIISTRLGEDRRQIDPNYDPNVDTSMYKNGYGSTSQDVLLYSFLAAYIGKDPNKINIHQPFTQMPLPNWRVMWKGLTNFNWFKEHFRSVTLNHGYQSTYAVSGFQTNMDYERGKRLSETRDQIGNYIPEKNLGQVVLSEQFMPFFGVDFTLKNSLMFRINYNRSRTLGLSFVNNQITEQRSDDISFGTGYRWANLPNYFKVKGNFNNELSLKFDLGIRTNQNILRRLDSDLDEMSQGSRVFTIAFNADYKISRMVTARLFFDRNQNNPFTSLQYKTSVTNAGIGVRLNLVQ
ncbi:MAG: cell surface protein SprA [Bacteroidales bacterium]|nr:cell surface protein SprA [Bacteroidales bacterium]